MVTVLIPIKVQADARWICASATFSKPTEDELVIQARGEEHSRAHAMLWTIGRRKKVSHSPSVCVLWLLGKVAVGGML
jgi:hypothetical protein